MTPAQEARHAGLTGLGEVRDVTGISLQTLNNWAKKRKPLFDTVIEGCVAKKKAALLDAAKEPNNDESTTN